MRHAGNSGDRIILTRNMRTVEERFWAKVEKTSGCWEWTAAKFSTGYGAIRIKGFQRSTHRVAWELCYGQIPAGLCVLHRCDNKSCVRPDHLWLGTNRENTKDMHQKKRWQRKSLGKIDTDRIRDLLCFDFTQQQIADWFGIARTYVSRVKSGTRGVRKNYAFE